MARLSDQEKQERKSSIELGDYVYDEKFKEVFVCNLMNIISIKLDFIGRYRLADANEVRAYHYDRRNE